MKYLKIRRGKGQKRANGSSFAVPLLVHKTKKYGRVVSEKAISKKKSILVTGAHDSGKSHWLSRLYQADQDIWRKPKAPALWLEALRPLTAWTDADCVVRWWDNKAKEAEKANDYSITPWKKLKAWQRQEKLSEYVQETSCVVFIDDAHKLSGRKLQLARQCVLTSFLFVIACSDEQRLPPNLRAVVLRRDPTFIRLDSEVPYDVTTPLVWMLVLVALGAGWWEVSLVLGGLQALASGRRSNRQD